MPVFIQTEDLITESTKLSKCSLYLTDGSLPRPLHQLNPELYQGKERRSILKAINAHYQRRLY